MRTIHAIVMGLLCTQAVAKDLRIEHVTIVSPEREAPLHDAKVTIRDDRIVAIESSAGAASTVAHGKRAAAKSTPGAGGSAKPANSAASNLGTAASNPGTEAVIDGTGLFLAPGLIDSHVHTFDPVGIGDAQAKANPQVASALREQAPPSYLLFGYTTLIDLISTKSHAAAWNALAVRPDLYFCGGAPIPGGYPPFEQLTDEDRQGLLQYMVIQRGEEAKAPKGVDAATHTPEAVITRMKADGARCVKTFYERGFGEDDELPVPRLDTTRDLVKAAHAAHMPVFIHANGTDAQEFALQAGADIIAHGMWHWNHEQKATELTPRAKQILDDVLKANTGWQPTMQVLYGLRDLYDPGFLADPRVASVVPPSAIEWYRSPQGQWYRDILAPTMMSGEVLKSNDRQAQWQEAQAALASPIARNRNATRYLVAHGGRLLFGTDTPSAPTYGNQPGLNGWREMQRWVEAGVTPQQVFRAATLANAEILGLSGEIGTVQRGKRANLLLLRADPTQTVDAYVEIAKVILHGKVLDPADLAANRHGTM